MYNTRQELNKILILQEEKKILLKNINGIGISRIERYRYCEKILSIKQVETEIQKKIHFMRTMERMLKK